MTPGHTVSTHVATLRALDWSKTDLGPMATWSQELRRTVNFLLADPKMAVVYWGGTKTVLYNEAYTHLLAEKHPSALGRNWKEL
jgi:hypothetical protein